MENKKTIFYKREPEDKKLPKAVICDLDGTVAWMQNRSPYDMSKVDEDYYDFRMVEILNRYMKDGVYVLFVSGRSGTEIGNEKTWEWLKRVLDKKAYIKNDQDGSNEYMMKLYMRIPGFLPDDTKDDKIKKVNYIFFIKNRYDVICAFDDKDECVNMWRELGLLCCQVNKDDPEL